MYVCKCRHVCSSGPKRGKACCQASLEQQQTFEMEYFKALLKINYTFRKQQTQRNTSLSSKLGGEPHTKQNVTNTSAVILPQAFHECHMTHPLLLPHLRRLPYQQQQHPVVRGPDLYLNSHSIPKWRTLHCSLVHGFSDKVNFCSLRLLS